MRMLASLAIAAVAASAATARADEVSLADGAAFAFDGRIDDASVARAVAGALATKKDVYVFSSAAAGDACAARDSFGDDLATVDTLLDAFYVWTGATYPGAVSVYVSATPAQVEEAAVELKPLVGEGRAVIVFAFCGSKQWLATDGKGLFF
jgi:hypothetical protein